MSLISVVPPAIGLSNHPSAAMSALPPRHASVRSASSATTATSTISAADTSTRWWSIGTKRPSLKNLLLGLPHGSSWSSRSAPTGAAADDAGSATETAVVADADAIATDGNADAAATSNEAVQADGVEAADVTAAPATSNTDEADAVGGGKTIDYWGSVALLVNNVTGGGMVLFAQTFQQSGWLLMLVCLLVLMVCCGLGGLMLVECMAMMPHNGRFARRVEYTTVMKHYCTRRFYIVIAVFYQLSLTITNLSLIVQSIQVMDFTIAAITGGYSCTVPEFYPSLGFHCPKMVDGNITVFDTSVWCIPLGLYFTALVVIPLGLVNLDDNIKVQKGAFVSLCVIILIWVGLLASNSPVGDRVPVIGTTLSSVLGVSLFNFAFLSSVPSWINEKREDVSIPKTLWTVLPLSVGLFVVMGWLGGTAFEWADGSNETMLDKVRGVTTAGKLGEVTFYLFPIIVNLTSIPVISIFQRYNLVKEGVCGLRMANFLAVVLPWLLAIPLYNGSGYQQLANWGGVLVTSVVNFIVPVAVYIIAVRRREKEMVNVHHLQDLQPVAAAEQITQAEPTLPTAAVEQTTSGKKLVKKLSVSSAVEWMRGLGSKKGSGMRDDDGNGSSGLQPSPMHHFSGNPASSSFSIASTHTSSDNDGELSGPSHSPETPSRAPPVSAAAQATRSSLNPPLSSQALRWAAEADKQRAANSASAASLSNTIPRDIIQSASGSLRIARSTTPTAPGSPVPSSHPSQRNLLSGLTSSFSAQGLLAPEPGLEMTPVSSARRPDEKVDDEVVEVTDDDFLGDIGAISVEEEGHHEDEDEQQHEEADQERVRVKGDGRHTPYASASAGTSLPAIEEAGREPSVSHTASVTASAALDLEERIRQEEAVDRPYAAESVVDLVADDERGAVWHVVKKEWEPYRVPVAVAVLAVMVILSILALEQQIQSSL